MLVLITTEYEGPVLLSFMGFFPSFGICYFVGVICGFGFLIELGLVCT